MSNVTDDTRFKIQVLRFNHMFIVDFDDTLFETEKYKLARMAALRGIGVSENDFWETYQEARNDANGLFAYSDERHAARLARRGYDDVETTCILRESTTGAVRFLDSEAHAFLKDLQTYGTPLVLLSLGDPATQELKVKAVGIAHYFERLFLVEENKQAAVQELLGHVPPGKSAWLINDKPAETGELAKAFPRLKAIAKMSPRFTVPEYEAAGVPFFKTLGEISHYVRTHSK